MNKVFAFFALFLVVFFAGCKQPTADPTTPIDPVPVIDGRGYVYNSNWDIVDRPNLITSKAAGTIPQATNDYVASYNASHTDNQLTASAEEIPIENAPAADVILAFADTNEHAREYKDVARTLVANNREGWALELQDIEMTTGRKVIMYVDCTPPPIVTPPVVLPNLWTAMVDRTTKTFYYSELNPSTDEAARRARDLQLEVDLIQLGRAGDSWLPMQYDDWYIYCGPTEFKL